MTHLRPCPLLAPLELHQQGARCSWTLTPNQPYAMPQGKFKPGKASGSIVKKKSLGKSVHKGDQQKLKRGNHVIKPKGKVAIAEGRVQLSITKGINARIEKTMTARTGGDGGKLHILKDEQDGAPLGAPLKSASFSKTQKKK